MDMHIERGNRLVKMRNLDADFSCCQPLVLH